MLPLPPGMMVTADRNRHLVWRQILQPEHPCASGLKVLHYLHCPGQVAADARDKHLSQHPWLILPAAARCTRAKRWAGSWRLCQMCCSLGMFQAVPCQS